VARSLGSGPSRSGSGSGREGPSEPSRRGLALAACGWGCLSRGAGHLASALSSASGARGSFQNPTCRLGCRPPHRGAGLPPSSRRQWQRPAAWPCSRRFLGLSRTWLGRCNRTASPDPAGGPGPGPGLAQGLGGRPRRCSGISEARTSASPPAATRPPQLLGILQGLFQHCGHAESGVATPARSVRSPRPWGGFEGWRSAVVCLCRHRRHRGDPRPLPGRERSSARFVPGGSNREIAGSAASGYGDFRSRRVLRARRSRDRRCLSGGRLMATGTPAPGSPGVRSSRRRPLSRRPARKPPVDRMPAIRVASTRPQQGQGAMSWAHCTFPDVPKRQRAQELGRRQTGDGRPRC